MALRDLTQQELSEFASSNDPTLIDVEAPNNTVYDEKNDRVLSLPQTLDDAETSFIIDRDIDGKGNFFGFMPNEDYPNFTIPDNTGLTGLPAVDRHLKSFGRGSAAGALSTPQNVGGLMVEAGETAQQIESGGMSVNEIQGDAMVHPFRALVNQFSIMFDKNEDLAKGGLALIERNKKYMAQSGYAKREGDGIAYDLGQGLTSMGAALGVAGLTRSPGTAAVMFGALQKSNIYMEAREAGVEPLDASAISTVAGMAEAALEKVGLDRFMKAFKGNSAVRRFIEGALVEGAQEGTQQATEEAITSVTDIRDQSFGQAAESILYSAALGSILGGPANVAIGAFVQKEAKDAGFPDEQAASLAKYAEENIDLVQEDMAEFIRKEVSPIAADNASAMEFMTLMQKFDNRTDLVDPEALEPEQRAAFDEYLKYFNEAVSSPTSREAVEKDFFKHLTSQKAPGKMSEESWKELAVGASKLVGARADAAARALGITPKEWYENQRLSVEVVRTPEQAVEVYQEKLDLLRGEKPAATPAEDENFDPQDLEYTARRLEEARDLTAPKVGMKKPIINWLRKRGGVHLGTPLAGELFHLGINTKSAPGLFKKGRAQGANMFGPNERTDAGDLDNIPAVEFNAEFDTQAEEDGNGYVSRDWLLDQIREEQFGKKLGEETAQVDEGFIQMLDEAGLDYRTATAQEVLQALGTDADVLAAARAIGEKLTAKQTRQVLGILEENPGMDVQDAVDEWAERAAIMGERSTLSQRDGDVKGNITFSEEGALIRLFEAADPSTLLHELGHLFLRDMRATARKSKRPMVQRDYRVLKEWLGVKGDKFTEAQEEKFARGFEAWLREGKAPTQELDGVFARFKEWLTAIYRSVRDLKVDLNDDVRQVFERMLGGDFARTEEEIKKRDEQKLERDYAKVALPPESTLAADTGKVFRDIGNLANDAFTPVSTRLGAIDVKLKHAVRKFMFRTGLYSHQDRVAVKGFVEAVGDKFEPADYRIFDLALKNRDTVKAEELIEKYGVQKEWEAVRGVLDDLYNSALDVGLDMGYIQDYFPRQVRRDKSMEYLGAIRNRPDWSEIRHALEEADPNQDFTHEEQAAFVNTYLRGFTSNRLNLTKPSFTKSRQIDYVTPEFNQYYDDSMSTLLQYIGGLRHGIESRKLFGKSETDTEKNIGRYVLSLIDEGVISADQEKELTRILKAVVDPTGTRGAVAWAKNASYIYLMGNVTSAITQIQDLAFSLALNGYYRTTGAFLRSVVRRPLLRKEDIGIDNILQEFEDNTRASSAVRTVFRFIGLEHLDNIGKETYITAAFGRLRSANKKGSPEWKKHLKDVFGPEAGQVSKDIENKVMSENVKYLLFSELSDVQPISMAEMPIGYLRGGNGRVFYMLKTYTVKQIDIYRTKIFAEIASGEPKRMAMGVHNLIKLSLSLMLMGMASDALKDLILGRPITLDDLITDNILKLFTLTKYQIYKGKQDGIAQTFWRTLFVPPAAQPVDDVMKDIIDIGFGDKAAKDSETLGRVPFIGKFYYWWWGGGAAKLEKDK